MTTKTYTVKIAAIEHYTINVEAEDKEQAEEIAWLLFPHCSAAYGENNVTDITCEGESNEDQ